MRSLAFRLTLGFMAVSLIGIVIVAGLATQFGAQEFGALAQRQSLDLLVNQLSAYYGDHGAWAGAETVLQASQGSAPEGIGRPAVAGSDGKIVLAGASMAVGQQVPSDDMAHAIPILVDGKRVGSLILDPAANRRPPPPPNEFNNRFRQNLALGMLGAIMASLILGVVLARTMTRPMRALTEATRAIAEGQLDQRVPVDRRDELGQLAESFNQMSAELARAQSLRKQMTADVAHELRTPLGVILGHAEALSDGVLPPTPETFAMVHEEATRLARIVEDLRTLSLSDAGELSIKTVPTDPRSLLERAARSYQAEAASAGVLLELLPGPALPPIDVDPDRTAQVLDNLLSNALRHARSRAKVSMAATLDAGQVVLSIRDDGEGVPADELARIFDRFYRADASRARSAGGSGLGLAIAKSLIEAQGGRIWAESAVGTGLTVHVALSVTGRPRG